VIRVRLAPTWILLVVSVACAPAPRVSTVQLSSACDELDRSVATFEPFVAEASADPNQDDSAFRIVTLAVARADEICSPGQWASADRELMKQWSLNIVRSNTALLSYTEAIAHDTVSKMGVEVVALIDSLRQEVCEGRRELQVWPSFSLNGQPRSLDAGYVMMQLGDSQLWRKLRWSVAHFPHPERDFQVTVVGFYRNTVYENAMETVPSPPGCLVNITVLPRH